MFASKLFAAVVVALGCGCAVHDENCLHVLVEKTYEGLWGGLIFSLFVLHSKAERVRRSGVFTWTRVWALARKEVTAALATGAIIGLSFAMLKTLVG
jgi:hypothetical protein